MRIQQIITFLVLVTFLSSCAASRIRKQEKTRKVVQKARSYMGTPYKYGGTTIMGMDCSGLLIRSYETIDVYLPRSTADQRKYGKKVKLHKLKPGDLVFLALSKKRRKVTHAGLVTDVRGPDQVWFIHASSSRGVVEENLMKDYYKKRLRRARRVIK